MSPTPRSLDELRIDRSSEAARRSRTPWIVALLLLLLLAAGLWLSRSRGVAVVRTAPAVPSAAGTNLTVLNASGYVVARRQATVSSKVTGKVVEVLIQEGMEVAADQVLARLDDTNARALLRLAEAQLETAKLGVAETRAQGEAATKELRRLTQLRRDGIASDAEFDVAEASARALQARLEVQTAEIAVAERQVALRQQELEDTVIHAPFAGKTTAKNAQPGEMISPISAGGGFTRTGIGTIVDMRSLEIEVDVNEGYLNRVQTDQRVDATLDAYPDWVIPGKVLAIIPTADRQKATVKVRIAFDQLDPRILPEMGVKVAFHAPPGAERSKASLAVPKAALRKEAGRDVVYRLQGDHVERRLVTVGMLRTDEVWLTDGLAEGDRVVVEGPTTLSDGARVREAQK